MVNHLAIDATGIEKSYGTLRVLSGVDLQVKRGSVFALLGPNGAGKTTTVRILATLTRADAGEIQVAGFDSFGTGTRSGALSALPASTPRWTRSRPAKRTSR